MQKLARAVVGTNNVDNCSRYCQSPATMGLFRTVGYGGDSGSIADIEQADLVLIVGSNTAESHPVLATRVKRAHKLHGQKLIVSDLRENEMARRADLHLRPTPSTDIVWLCAVARYILDEGLADSEFLSRWVNGLAEYRQSLEPFTLEFASKTCNLPVETLKRVAHMIAEAKTCLHPLGDGRHPAQQRVRHLHGDFQSAARHRQLHAPGHRRISLCEGTTTSRAPATTAPCPTSCPGYQSVDDPEVRARFRSRLGRRPARHQGSGQSRDGRRHPRRQACGRCICAAKR